MHAVTPLQKWLVEVILEPSQATNMLKFRCLCRSRELSKRNNIPLFTTSFHHFHNLLELYLQPSKSIFMRIAIVGAGLSGLCFYLFLRNTGLLDAHDVLIYEFRDVTEGDSSSPEAESNYNASLNGGALGLALNGLNVLRRLDQVLYEEIIKAGHHINSWKLSNARGWKLGEIPAKFEGESGIMIWRRDIWRCFRKRVVDSAFVRKKLVNVEVPQVGPQILHFSDETCAPADLVIGADGIWSVVRKAVLEEPNASKFLPHYEGLVGCGGVVPLEGMKTIPHGQMK